jgi:hypothetical protein
VDVPEGQVHSTFALPQPGLGMLASDGDRHSPKTSRTYKGALGLNEIVYMAPIQLFGRDANPQVSDLVHLALETESTALVGASHMWQVLNLALDTKKPGAQHDCCGFRLLTLQPVKSCFDTGN